MREGYYPSEEFGQEPVIETEESIEAERQVFDEIRLEFLKRSIKLGQDIEAHAEEWASAQEVELATAFETLRNSDPSIVADWQGEDEEKRIQIIEKIEGLMAA